MSGGGLLVVVVALIAVLGAVALVVDRSQQRRLAAWAQEQGGTFEAGSLTSRVLVPEATPFDVELVFTQEENAPTVPRLEPDEDVKYRSVARIPGDRASFVVAEYSRSDRDFHDKVEITSFVVCFVTLPGVELPQVDVGHREGPRSTWPEELSGGERPQPIRVSEAVPGFAKRFEVNPAHLAGAPAHGAVARLLNAKVQAELLAQADLIAALEVRGNVVRVDATSKSGYSAKEMLEVSRRLAAAWLERARF